MMTRVGHLFLVLALLQACKCESAPPDTLESVAREVALTFPPGTRLLGVHRERGIDDLVAAKVAMPAAQWSTFLAGTPIAPALFEPGEHGRLGPDQGFWDPHKATNLRTAQARLPNARVLNLGYDDAHPPVVIVYIVNHGT
jgi:hypothetical protein